MPRSRPSSRSSRARAAPPPSRRSRSRARSATSPRTSSTTPRRTSRACSRRGSRSCASALHDAVVVEHDTDEHVGRGLDRRDRGRARRGDRGDDLGGRRRLAGLAARPRADGRGGRRRGRRRGAARRLAGDGSLDPACVRYAGAADATPREKKPQFAEFRPETRLRRPGVIPRFPPSEPAGLRVCRLSVFRAAVRRGPPRISLRRPAYGSYRCSSALSPRRCPPSCSRRSRGRAAATTPRRGGRFSSWRRSPSRCTQSSRWSSRCRAVARCSSAASSRSPSGSSCRARWAVDPDGSVLEAERTLVYAGAAAAALLLVPQRLIDELVLGRPRRHRPRDRGRTG